MTGWKKAGWGILTIKLLSLDTLNLQKLHKWKTIYLNSLLICLDVDLPTNTSPDGVLSERFFKPISLKGSIHRVVIFYLDKACEVTLSVGTWSRGTPTYLKRSFLWLGLKSRYLDEQLTVVSDYFLPLFFRSYAKLKGFYSLIVVSIQMSSRKQVLRDKIWNYFQRSTFEPYLTTHHMRTRPHRAKRPGFLSRGGTFCRLSAKMTPPGGRPREWATAACEPRSSHLLSSRRGQLSNK